MADGLVNVKKRLYSKKEDRYARSNVEVLCMALVSMLLLSMGLIMQVIAGKNRYGMLDLVAPVVFIFTAIIDVVA